MTLTTLPYQPQVGEVALSRQASRTLANHHPGTITKFTFTSAAGVEESVQLPETVYRLLVDVLNHMAKGQAVTLVPMGAELTTQEAANLLNVSRPYLIKQIEAGELPCRKVGSHRRIRFEAVMHYKQRLATESAKALDEMVALSEELGLYQVEE